MRVGILFVSVCVQLLPPLAHFFFLLSPRLEKVYAFFPVTHVTCAEILKVAPVLSTHVAAGESHCELTKRLSQNKTEVGEAFTELCAWDMLSIPL